MAEGSISQKVDPNLVAEIVSSYVGNNGFAIDGLGGLIAIVARQPLRC
jgi:predicted transcriptional regulator